MRVIAASNRNLEEAIEHGILREDLYYRLNVVQLTMPDLRTRSGDIPLLVDYFLKLSAERTIVRTNRYRMPHYNVYNNGIGAAMYVNSKTPSNGLLSSRKVTQIDVSTYPNIYTMPVPPLAHCTFSVGTSLLKLSDMLS